MDLMTFTDDNFDAQVLQCPQVVLVDFWASWCMPCQMLTPIIEEIAGEVSDGVKIGKLNVDENKQTAAKFNVMSIPTVFVFKGGEVVEQITGLRQKEEYLEALKKHTS